MWITSGYILFCRLDPIWGGFWAFIAPTMVACHYWGDHIPDVVYALGALTTLIVSDNQIAQLDVGGLQRCAALTTLELTNNSIAEVPPELGLLPLKALKLEGNLFRTPRPAVLAKGTPAVLEYLRGRIVQ